MATDTAIVMAWQDMGCPHRFAAFEFMVSFWSRYLPEYPIVIGEAEPFSRAAGINDGVRRAWSDYGATIIFQPDPDTIIDPDVAREAIGMARSAPGVIVPYGHYLYLSEESSRRILAGEPYADFGIHDCDASGEFGSGLVACYSRETWEKAGGFDERFGVWAGDDGAFQYASHWLVAPGRRVFNSYAYHLWHPRHPDSYPGTPGYAKQFAILAPYRDAESADDIRAIIEGRET